MRFSKNHKVDGWPVHDALTGADMSKDEIIDLLNMQNEKLKRLTVSTDYSTKRWTALRRVGQIKVGSRIMFNDRGVTCYYKAEDVLNPNTEKEEVIIDCANNKYFIVSMAIDGTSWAKDVHVLNA